ncbi:MAG: hypothetical protein MI923_03050 [Phycisphaerales bacterium]|nr:hypothetical protein [Phycisphaerales bacterium]
MFGTTSISDFVDKLKGRDRVIFIPRSKQRSEESTIRDYILSTAKKLNIRMVGMARSCNWEKYLEGDSDYVTYSVIFANELSANRFRNEVDNDDSAPIRAANRIHLIGIEKYDFVRQLG